MTIVELYGISQLEILTYDKNSSFPFKVNVKRNDQLDAGYWSHFFMNECEIIQSCLDLQLPNQLEIVLDYLNIPKDLTVKERMSYYYLLTGEGKT